MKRLNKKYYYVAGGNYDMYSQAALTAGSLIDSMGKDPSTGVQSDVGAGLSGALKGAGTGAAIGSVVPGIGTAIGAGVGFVGGAISGLLGNSKAKKAAEEADRKRKSLQNQFNLNRSSATLSNYDTTGSDTNQIYAKLGGKIPNLKLNGGELKPLSDESVEVEGNSHEQGGVELNPQVEVEGNETIKGNFVYSDSLPANLKGQSFADVHKRIAKSIGKIESKYNSPIRTNTLNLLRKKEEALKTSQEYLKNQLGIKPIAEV